MYLYGGRGLCLYGGQGVISVSLSPLSISLITLPLTLSLSTYMLIRINPTYPDTSPLLERMGK